MKSESIRRPFVLLSSLGSSGKSYWEMSTDTDAPGRETEGKVTLKNNVMYFYLI